MRVVVVGGTGVVGAPAVRRLAAAGHEVVAVTRRPEAAERLRADGAAPVVGDPTDEEVLRRVLPGADAAITLLTHIPPYLRAALPGAFRENDRLRDQATRTLVEVAQAVGVGRIVRDSVSFAYADGGDSWLSEEAPLRPGRALRTAVRGEDHVRGFAGEGVVLRFGLFRGDPDSLHAREAARLASRGITLTLGRASAWISLLHVEDAAAAVAAALTAPPGTYNVAEEPVRRTDWLTAQERAAGRRLRRPPTALAALGGSVVWPQLRSHRVSSARFQEATGWAPQQPPVTAAT